MCSGKNKIELEGAAENSTKKEQPYRDRPGRKSLNGTRAAGSRTLIPQECSARFSRISPFEKLRLCL